MGYLARNVLFSFHGASRTGAPLLSRDIAAGLASVGYECAFVLAADGPLRPDFENIGRTIVLPLYPNGPKYLREIPFALSRINVLRTFKPDLVYCNTIHTVKWIPYAHLLGIPVLTHVHELSMGFSVLAEPEFRLLRRSDSIMAVSNAVASYLGSDKGVAPDRIRTIHAGIVQREHRPGRVRSDSGVVIGLVGRITPMKGSDMLPELIGMVDAGLQRRGHADPVRYLIAASTDDRPSYEMFRREIVRAGFSDRVEIIEDVQQLDPLYARMDIFLTLAREDPFPLVVLEAMHAGLPVVGFATGGIPEAVDDRSGILVPLPELSKVEAAICDLVTDPARRNALGAGGRERASAKFNLKNSIPAIAAFCEETIARGVRR